jgi:hypothetical protein
VSSTFGRLEWLGFKSKEIGRFGFKSITWFEECRQLWESNREWIGGLVLAGLEGHVGGFSDHSLSLH